MGFAGCVSTGNGSDPGGTDTAAPTEFPTATPTESPTATPTETPTESPTATPIETSTSASTPTSGTPRVVDRSFEVTGRECGTGEEGAEVTLDAPRIDVEGTAAGSNGCETARLGEASYDPDADTLTIVVEVYQPDDTGACTQCLTDIDYRLRVRFEGGTPGSVRVVHDSTVVTETEVA